MSKKGASLIWALIMSTAMLFISVTVANTIISESKMSVRMDDSSQAYAAAESGIEWGKYCLNLPTSESTTKCPDGINNGPFNLGSSTYTVKITRAENKIESLGTKNGVNRKLSYTIAQNQTLDSVDDLKKGVTVSGSYIQQFDYWSNGNTVDIGKIGLSSGDGSKAIYFESLSDSGYKVRLAAKNGSTYLNSSSTDVAFVGMATPYILRVRIEYTDGISAKMIVMQKDWAESGSYKCISSVTLDLRSSGISPKDDFGIFYFAQGSTLLTPVADSSTGDGSVYKLSTSNSVFFDNMSTSGIESGPSTLTVTKSGNGTVTSNPSGINCDTTCSSTFPDGVVVTLTASTVPADKSYFTGWSGEGCTGTGSCVVTMNTAKTVTATFAPNRLTVTTIGGGTITSSSVSPAITCGSSCSGDYTIGTSVLLTATPSSGYSFSNWAGACSGTALTCTVAMTSAKSATATFTQNLPVYRYYSASTGDHFYVTAQGSYGGYVLEGQVFNSANPSQTGAVPVYRYWNATVGDHYYTTTYGTYGGYVYEGVVFYAFPGGTSGAVWVYQYFNASVSDHFYIADGGAGGYGGYTLEGPAFLAKP